MRGGDSADGDAGAGPDALSRFLEPQDHLGRTHHVTALLVAHEGAPWLPRTLHALAGQDRAPDRILALDAGSSDDSEALLRTAIGEVLIVDGDVGLAGALAAGSARSLPRWARRTGAGGSGSPSAAGAAGWGSGGHASGEHAPDGPGQARWLWILHDDSAPDPDCLAQLLRGAERNPAATIVIPKTVAWSDHGRLVGIGHRWAPGVPLVNRLEPRERDQGQYDVDRPVYAGNSAGMLVEAATWQALGGMDPAIGGWAAPADLCRRVWGCGGEVVFIPQAVVAHRQAGRLGVRRGSEDRPSPRRAERHGQLLLEISQAPPSALPWRWLRGWITTLLRALALLLTREPEEAAAELTGAWDALAHPRRIGRARRSLRQPPVTSAARPPHVRARRGAVLSRALDEWSDGQRRRPRVRVPRRVWFPLAVAGALALLAVMRQPGTILGAGDLHGGGLLPAPGGMELLRGYLSGWQDARLGVPTSLPAYLPLLSAASLPLLGSVDLLLRLVVGLAVPLAFLSAYLSIGPRWAGEQRIALALAWSVLPAGVAAAGAGRLSTLAVLLLGPPAVRLLVRALARARRPGSRIHPAIAAGAMLGVLSAFAPICYVLVLLGAVLAWPMARLPRWPVRSALVVLAVAGLFAVLIVPRVWEAPWLLLAEVGRSDLSLVDPAPWPWGLSPGGPSALAWPGLPLVVVAVVAVARRGRGARAALALLGALALMAAAAWLPAAAQGWTGSTAPSWPGIPLLVAAGILAALAARLAPPAGRGAPILAWAWRGSVAVLVAGWLWAPVVIGVGPSEDLPAVVALDAQSPARPRVLVLTRAGDAAPPAAIRYAVGTGSGPRLGDADALASPYRDPALDDVVGALVSGSGLDAGAELGGRGIRYVVLDGPPGDPLALELDAATGLRRLSGTAAQSLWLVAGQPARAELAEGGGQGSVVVPVLTTPTQVEVVLHPRTPLPRLLSVAEGFDGGWRAQLDGRPVALREDENGMLSAGLTRTGLLAVSHRSGWPVAAAAQLVAMAIVIVLALPKRRTVDLDGETRG